MMRWSSPRRRVLVACAALAVAACSSNTSTDTAQPAGNAQPAAAVGTGNPTAPATEAADTAPPDPSPGCGTSTVRAQHEQRQTLTVKGAERWFLLTTPPQHDGTTPLPLVLDFHGLFEGAAVHANMSGFSAVAEKEGFVVAFPNGSGNPIHWDASPNPGANDDLAFVDAMLDGLGRSLCLDRSRVYATGLSYGAIMTSTLLCTHADRLAAAAPVAGLQMPAQGCEGKRKVPVLTFHGTADNFLPFAGGVGSAVTGLLGGKTAGTPPPRPPADLNGPGYPATVKAWAEKNGCGSNPTDTPVTGTADTGASDSTTVIHRVYDCPRDTAVEFYIIEGGGHAWPGSAFSKGIANIVGPTTTKVDATATAWAFFKRFHLPH